eukprot:3788913-Pleurochrysis_carterae.AAC.1
MHAAVQGTLDVTHRLLFLLAFCLIARSTTHLSGQCYQLYLPTVSLLFQLSLPSSVFLVSLRSFARLLLVDVIKLLASGFPLYDSRARHSETRTRVALP